MLSNLRGISSVLPSLPTWQGVRRTVEEVASCKKLAALVALTLYAGVKYARSTEQQPALAVVFAASFCSMALEAVRLVMDPRHREQASRPIPDVFNHVRRGVGSALSVVSRCWSPEIRFQTLMGERIVLTNQSANVTVREIRQQIAERLGVAPGRVVFLADAREITDRGPASDAALLRQGHHVVNVIVRAPEYSRDADSVWVPAGQGQAGTLRALTLTGQWIELHGLRDGITIREIRAQLAEQMGLPVERISLMADAREILDEGPSSGEDAAQLRAGGQIVHTIVRPEFNDL